MRGRSQESPSAIVAAVGVLDLVDTVFGLGIVLRAGLRAVHARSSTQPTRRHGGAFPRFARGNFPTFIVTERQARRLLSQYDYRQSLIRYLEINECAFVYRKVTFVNQKVTIDKVSTPPDVIPINDAQNAGRVDAAGR